MKRLLVLWDPENPLTPVGSVIRDLGMRTALTELTFRHVSHRTLPNGSFTLEPKADAILWVEGGPLPDKPSCLICPVVGWFLNLDLEPTLFDDLGPLFTHRLVGRDLRADRILEALWPSHPVEVSVLVTCYRYLRRFRLCLESLARQEIPLEIVVADPGSPDGLADYLPEFAARHPHLRVVHLPIDPLHRRNRGLGINRAFDASVGKVIVSIDGDLLFPPHLVRTLADHVNKDPRFVYGVRRDFLSRPDTEALLRGEAVPLQGGREDGEPNALVGVLGYCQAVRRDAFAKARYPEEFDQVNQSDIEFVGRLRKSCGIEPRFLEDEAVLHLWHPRNWSGTEEDL